MSNPTENIFGILAEEDQIKVNKENRNRKENSKSTKSATAATDKSKPKDKPDSVPVPQTQNQGSSPQGKLHSRIFVNLSCFFFLYFNIVGTVC
jgi:hypothetical protein